MVNRLRTLCQAENIEADDHALMLIARSATGSLRDAISLLDQLASSNSMRITVDDVREALGATDAATVRGLMEGIASHDAAAGMDTIQTAIDQGSDARQIALQMIDFLRAVLQVKVSQKDVLDQKGEISESERQDLSNFAGRVSAATLLRGIRAFSASINEMRSSVDAQLPLVMAYLECAVTQETAEEASRRPETAGQKPEAASQRPEARGQKPELKGQKSEVRSQKPEAGSQKPEVRTLYQKTGPEAETRKQEMGPVTAETLRSIWKQLISEVNAVNKPAAALLRSCHPYSVDGDIIRIKADHDLFRQRLDDPRNKDIVTSTINQLLSGRYVVHVFTGQPEQEPNPNDDPLVKAAQKLGGKLRE
jgi:DNA polymerase-3 subunit gamma/tau